MTFLKLDVTNLPTTAAAASTEIYQKPNSRVQTLNSIFKPKLQDRTLAESIPHRRGGELSTDYNNEK